MVISSGTRTVPGWQTRPRSLRPRSTSIRCSARSFGSCLSSSASARSSLSVAPRGRVPAIGRVSARSRSFAHEKLRRRPHDVQLREMEAVHVRRGIHHPKRPVDLKRRGRRFQHPALRQNDLDDVARADVLLGARDGGLVTLARHQGLGGFWRREAFHRFWRLAALKPGDLLLDRANTLSVKTLKVFHALLVFRYIHVGDDLCELGKTVEYDHLAGEVKGGGGKSQVIAPSVRKVFKEAHRVVIPIADRSAPETRKAGKFGGNDAGKNGFFKSLKRILRRPAALGGPFADRSPVALTDESGTRPSPDKRITPEALPALDAFQQERMRLTFLEAFINGDWRDPVDHDLPAQRHQVVPPGQTNNSGRLRGDHGI